MNKIVWKESVYKNKFKCKMCGRKLASVSGQPTDNLVFKSEDNTVSPAFCKCGELVATVELNYTGPVPEMDEDGKMLLGSYSDWLEEQKKKIRKEVTTELQKKIYEQFYDRLEKLGEMIKGLTASNEQIKKDKDKIIKKKDKLIEEKEKEILRLEHRLKEMEEGRIMNDNT